MNKKSILKGILAIVKTMVGIFAVAFILVVFLQRFSDNKISFFSYRMFTVITGSMEPDYSVGDVLIAKSVDPSTIKTGDVITYTGKVSSFNKKIITHEVIGISKDENDKYVFRAKGKANLVEDPAVSEDQLLGVVIYKSKILSLIYRIISKKIGFYILIIVPILFVIGSEIISTMLEKEEKRREKNNSN